MGQKEKIARGPLEKGQVVLPKVLSGKVGKKNAGGIRTLSLLTLQGIQI